MQAYYIIPVPDASGQPPGIWGPPGPWVSPPIANVPGAPGYNPPGQPPHIWGPPGPWVSPPIANVPGAPGYNPGQPPHIWGPPGPWPTPPIVIPPGTPIPPGTDVIWPPPGPLTGIENPITIVPAGKVMVYVNGWIIVDQPPAAPAADAGAPKK